MGHGGQVSRPEGVLYGPHSGTAGTFVPIWEVSLRHSMFYFCFFSLLPDTVSSLSRCALHVFPLLCHDPLDPSLPCSKGSVKGVNAYHWKSGLS